MRASSRSSGRPNVTTACARKPSRTAILDLDTWLRWTPAQQGSWWPAWVGGLADRSGAPVPGPGSNRARGRD
jgi:hypothetical protein